MTDRTSTPWLATYQHYRNVGQLPAQATESTDRDLHGTKLELIADALQLARDLNEPDEDTDEYARGQENLIADMFGLHNPDRYNDERMYGLLMDIIQHRVGFSDGLAQLAEEMEGAHDST